MADWRDPNAQNLPPGLLAAIMGSQQQTDPTGNGLMRTYVDPSGRSFIARAAWDQMGQGDGAYQGNTASNWTINEDLGGRNGQAFNQDGTYAGHYRSQGPWQDLLTAAAMIGGGYFGGNYLAGMGAEGAGALSGMDIAADAGMGAIGSGGSLPAGAVGTGGAVGGGAGGAAGGGAAGGGGAGGLSGMDVAADAGMGAIGSGGSIGAGGGSLGSLGGLLSGSNLGGLLGAAVGAYDARDQQQATNRDPWGPAQPLLRSLIDQTGAMSERYQQNPFSQAQQGAYRNQFGLLDAINGMAPGLMAGMQANASGANAYDRTNPRRQLTGSTAQMQWNPQSLLGLLNFGGGNGG